MSDEGEVDSDEEVEDIDLSEHLLELETEIARTETHLRDLKRRRSEVEDELHVRHGCARVGARPGDLCPPRPVVAPIREASWPLLSYC